MLATPQPVLLSALPGAFVLKKIASMTTSVVWLRTGRSPALWITGGRHVVIFPTASPRLAGNVLIWEADGITYRLEGRRLSQAGALRLAGEITGT